MISEAAGAGAIRQDVQQAIESEVRYRLGEGDAPGALSRWHKELLLLVIQTVKANACLRQLHVRAAVKAGATLAQALQVIQEEAGKLFKVRTLPQHHQKPPGYCWSTPECRNWCVQHAFFEGKKAQETFTRKSTPRTLK